MKTTKKLLAILLVVVMVLTAVPLSGFVGLELPSFDFGIKASAKTVSSSGSYGDNVTYTYNSSTGELVISGTGAMYSYFYSSDSPFYNSNIKSVVIEDGVTSIGRCAFFECYSLTSVTIGDSVTTIGDYAFYDCDSLTSVTIGDSVTTIGDYAFYDCDSLASVTIPDGVTLIASSAFCNTAYYNNSSNWENNVLYIGNHLIDAKQSLSGSYTIKEGTKRIVDHVFENCNNLTSVTIPDSVTSIGNRAFYNCKSLTSVTIPDSVTTIGVAAFYDCSSLTSVTIPDSVTTIGNDAFCYCNNLTSVTIGDGVTSIGSYAFRNCTSLTSVTLGDSVTTIGYQAFCNCTSLTNITIPDSVTTIGYETFSNCYSLTNVTIGKGVESIGNSAFWSCISLKNVTIPNSVTSIGDSAFYELNHIGYEGTEEQWNKISLGVDVISESAYLHFEFDETDITETVTTPATCMREGEKSKVCSCGYVYEYGVEVLPIVDCSFSYYKSNGDGTCQKPGTKTAYCDYGCGATDTINDDSVGKHNYYMTEIISATCVKEGKAVYKCKDCSESYEEVLPKTDHSFSCWVVNGSQIIRTCTVCGYTETRDTVEINGQCGDNLTWTFDIITGVLTISGSGDMYNYNCYTVPWLDYRTSIKSVVLLDGLTSIGDAAFENCYNLTSITIPDSVTLIGDSAFICCERLESITIPDSVKLIGEAAFAFCTSLENITIPEGVPSISLKMFDRCTSLESVTIPDSITSIDSGAFAGCSNLESVTIPNSVTSIGDAAFYGLNHIGYEGTQEQWNKISLGKDVVNESAYLHFEFDPETVITEVVTIPATCIKEGAISKVCSCGYVYKDGVEVLPIEPNAHLCNDEYIITKAPTCCEEGEKAVFCLLCGVKDEKSVTKIEKLAHSFSKWIVEENKSTRYCFDCGYTETKFNTDDGDVEIEYPENPNTNFEVDEIIPTDDNYIIVDEAIGDNVNVVKAFDINLKNKDGVHVQPDGTVKVKLPLDWEKEGNYKVYRVNDDGTLTDMNAYRQGSHMVFDTDHFSIYVIVHQHTYKSTIIPPSCTEQGYTTCTCECGDTYTETIEPTGHNFDGSKCTNCDYDKADDCSCNCHKGGIAGFFFKLILFFQKIFKTNKTCSCGVAHY